MSKPEAFLPRPEPEAAVRGGRGGWRDRQTDRHTTPPPPPLQERSCPACLREIRGPKRSRNKQPGGWGGGGRRRDTGTHGRGQKDRSEREITRSARRGFPAAARLPQGLPSRPAGIGAGPVPAAGVPHRRLCRALPDPGQSGGEGGCSRSCDRRCPLPPNPQHSHRRFPGSSSSSSTAEPRRSPPAAPRRWGGPGRGEGRAATGTGRVQFALSSSPALPHLLPSPRPREKASALRGAAPRGRGRGRGGSRRRRSVSAAARRLRRAQRSGRGGGGGRGGSPFPVGSGRGSAGSSPATSSTPVPGCSLSRRCCGRREAAGCGGVCV